VRWQASYYVKVSFEGDEAREAELFLALERAMQLVDLEPFGGEITFVHVANLERERGGTRGDRLLAIGRHMSLDHFPEGVTFVTVDELTSRRDSGTDEGQGPGRTAGERRRRHDRRAADAHQGSAGDQL
jgi:hypothetical protein